MCVRKSHGCRHREAREQERRDTECETAALRRLQLRHEFVDDGGGKGPEPCRRDLTAKRRLAGVVTGVTPNRCCGSDQLAAQTLRAFAEIAAGVAGGADRRDARGDLFTAGADRTQPVGRRRPARFGAFGVRPRLGQLATEGRDLRFSVERELRIWRRGLELGGLELGLADQLGEPYPAIGHVGETAREPRAFGHDPPAGLGAQHLVQSRQPLLIDGDRSQAGPRVSDGAVEDPQPGGGDAKWTGATPFGPHPIHRRAEADERLGGGGAPARIGKALDRFLQLDCSLPGAFGRVDAQPVVAEPGSGAEHRLVDPQVKATWRDRASAAQLVSQLRPTELEYLHRLLACVEPAGNPDAAPVIQPVGERQAISAASPRLVACPVRAIDCTTLASGVEAIERTAHRPEQRRLARTRCGRR